MWTWLMNPKNLLLAICGVLCVTFLIVLLWYRGSYQASVSEAKIAKAESAEKTLQLEEYARDMVLVKAHNARMQEIERSASSDQEAVDSLTKRELTNEEIVVAQSITDRINRVLPKAGGSEILPAPDKASTDSTKNSPSLTGKLQ